MNDYKIFELEAKLDKISTLILNCITCDSEGVDISELLEYLQAEYNQVIDDFQKFEKEIFPLFKE